jgi:OOP family OmpA-OmpF porin
MTKSIPFFAKTTLVAALLTAASLSLMSPAFAAKTDGYVTGADGSIARNADGSCWRSGSWTPALALPECQAAAAAAAVAPSASAKSTPAVAPTPAANNGSTAIRLSSDGLFDYAKSTLGKSSDAELANIAEQLKSSSQITITGHTDRLGNAGRNMAISKARAESVKRYLVSKGIKPATITTIGMGSKSPVTTAAQCPGNATPAVIACLRSDRRVDIVAR